MQSDFALLEDGYIRYDKDEDGYMKAKERNEEHKHPLFHLDIFHSSQTTFKLGLENEFIDTDLQDMLDSTSNCRYIKKF